MPAANTMADNATLKNRFFAVIIVLFNKVNNMGLIIELADEKCRSRIIYINSKEGSYFRSVGICLCSEMSNANLIIIRYDARAKPTIRLSNPTIITQISYILTPISYIQLKINKLK